MKPVSRLATILMHLLRRSVLSAPQGATVTFDPPLSELETDKSAGLNPSVTFDEIGTYILKLIAFGDGQPCGTDTITIIASIGVDAGEDQIVFLPERTANLSGLAPGATSTMWVYLGQEYVTFDPPLSELEPHLSAELNVTAYFPERKIGRYVLWLVAFDDAGSVVTWDAVIVRVSAAEIVVEAGDPQEITWPNNHVDLDDAFVEYDDTLIDPATVDTLWSSLGGVTFDDQEEVDTGATFTAPGIYELELSASIDGVLAETDTVIITVEPEGDVPQVEAGSLKWGQLSGGTDEIPLDDAWIWDDGIFNPLYLTPHWTQEDGPAGGVSFDNEFTIHPTATFTQSGIYWLKLTAKDGGSPVGDDTVEVIVYDEAQELIVHAGGSHTIEMLENGPAEIWLHNADIIVQSTGEVVVSWLTVSGSVITGEDAPKFIDGVGEGEAIPVIYDAGYATPVKPIVQFFVAGTYTLRLTATQEGSTVPVSNEVTILVLPYGEMEVDTDAPTIDDFFVTKDGEQVAPDSQVCGQLDISVPASDVGWGIDKIELRWYDENGELLKEVSGAPSYPEVLQLDYVINTHFLSNGPHTLYARVIDRANLNSGLAFSFESIGPSTGNPPQAAITNAEFYLDSKCQVPKVNPLYVLTEGQFILEGSAYHPDFGDDAVTYYVDLFKPQIAALPLNEWNNDTYILHEECHVKPIPIDGADSKTGCIQNGTLGELDFTGVENGTYQMLLTVIAGGLESHVNVGFILDCPQKIGNVRFSQEDLVIPVGGIPLRVIRTYDSLDKERDSDFGYGWSYSIASLDIELDENRAEGVQLKDFWSNPVSRSVRTGSNLARNVTLNLPDGERATFIFYLDYDGIAQYESPPGVTAKLTTEDEERMVGTFFEIYWEKQGHGIVGQGLADPANYDFSGYVLTTEDGTQFHIQREDYSSDGACYWYNDYPLYAIIYGEPYLSKIVTPSGETIVLNVDPSSREIGAYGDRGIRSYQSGVNPETDPANYTKSIKIEYDIFGHITGIWAPSEQLDEFTDDDDLATIEYVYNGVTGDLLEVRKLVDKDDLAGPKYETTTYVYNNHYITDIEDSRGISPIRYVYDAYNRLDAIYDAKNNYIDINHNDDRFPTDNVEVVVDRLSNETIYFYNERGNITRVRNALDYNTLYQYTDLVDNPDKPTYVHVQSDSAADPLEDPLTYPDHWSTTRYEYDDKGRPLIVTDPEYNVTTNVYDELGSVVETMQWRPLDSTPDFPHDYPNQQPEPTEYAEVSRTTNEYYYNDNGTLNLLGDGLLTNLLAWTENTVVFDDPGTSGVDETEVEHTKYYYDDKNRIDRIEKLADPTPGGITSDYDVITSYRYDTDVSGNYLSNSPDQPYSISEPHYRNETAIYIHFFEYDNNGRQVRSWYDYIWTDAQGTHTNMVTIETVYDDAGRVIRNERETHKYVGEGAPYEETVTVILSETIYNNIGKPEMVEGEHLPGQEGMLTIYEYDDLGNLVETRTYESYSTYTADPVSNILTITQTLYDAEGRVLVTVDAHDPADIANGTETVYDELGRVRKTRRWADVEIQMEDIVVGSEVVGKRSIGWTTEGGAPVLGAELSYSRTEYDVAGRVKMTVALDEDGYEQPTSYEYDDAGKQTAVIDPLGHNIDYIQQGKWYVIDPATLTFNGIHRTETQYEGTRRSAVIDARAFEAGAVQAHYTTSFSYDAIGRLITTTHPPADLDGNQQIDDLTYTYTYYDTLGRKVEKSAQTRADRDHDDDFTEPSRDWRLRKRTFEYDAGGRLTKVLLAEPEDGAGIPEYRYIYDKFGNLVGIIDPIRPDARLTVFEYDHLNKQSRKYMPFEVTNQNTILTAQDVYDALTTEAPTTWEERWYDDLGRLDTVKDFEGNYTVYEYATAGCGCKTPGQLVAQYFYDGDPYGSGVLHSQFDYTYDNLGRKVTEKITEYVPTDYVRWYENIYVAESKIEKVNIYESDASYGAGTAEDSVAYTYIPETGQRSSVSTDDGGTEDNQVAYTYDKLGRLSEVPMPIIITQNINTIHSTG
jgi:YD repeat-containing protein